MLALPEHHPCPVLFLQHQGDNQPWAQQGSKSDATWFYRNNKIQEKTPETTQRNKLGMGQEVAGGD